MFILLAASAASCAVRRRTNCLPPVLLASDGAGEGGMTLFPPSIDERLPRRLVIDEKLPFLPPIVLFGRTPLPSVELVSMRVLASVWCDDVEASMGPTASSSGIS